MIASLLLSRKPLPKRHKKNQLLRHRHMAIQRDKQMPRKYKPLKIIQYGWCVDKSHKFFHF